MSIGFLERYHQNRYPCLHNEGGRSVCIDRGTIVKFTSRCVGIDRGTIVNFTNRCVGIDRGTIMKFTGRCVGIDQGTIVKFTSRCVIIDQVEYVGYWGFELYQRCTVYKFESRVGYGQYHWIGTKSMERDRIND
ncbi:hypothetical protein Btru_025441 [Bulinus truncatus]|nr:hypothetical protein Btru_025441 [Bulinus truncatus]